MLEFKPKKSIKPNLTLFESTLIKTLKQIVEELVRIEEAIHDTAKG
jgi:hypothetical protein